MRLDFVSLFPEMFESVLGSSILKRAGASAVSYHLHDPRAFTDNKHNKVDDTPYGGGAGMVMQCQPVYDCVMSAEAEQPELAATRIVVTPTGVPLTQPLVEELSRKPRLLILCGHYEGFDQRLLDELSPMQVSLGDYVLTGGELPAMVLADAVVRLIPGVIGKASSHENDSFSPGSQRLLDHPHYTRPPQWMGRAVPEVLLSGDHAKIDQWRREQSEQLTRQRRPDLFTDRWDGRPARQRIGQDSMTGRTPVPPFNAPIVLRDATDSDHDAIDAILRAAFDTDAEAKLVRSLREQGDAPVELVAEVDLSGTARVIGSVVFSPIHIEGGDGRLRALGLAPLAVDPVFQGRGVGRALVRQGIRACAQARAGAVFVLGEPGYYGPLGFETASAHGFANTFGVDDPFMVYPLKEDLGPPGTAKYAPAFSAL